MSNQDELSSIQNERLSSQFNNARIVSLGVAGFAASSYLAVSLDDPVSNAIAFGGATLSVFGISIFGRKMLSGESYPSSADKINSAAPKP